MKEQLLELFRYRELLYGFAQRDIKVRYKQSVMGFLWAILTPVLIVLSGVVVRYAYAIAAHLPLQATDVAGVAVKALPWAFLVSSIRFGCNSLVNNRDLVSKVYFPKEVFPMAAVVASLYDFFVASAALVIFLLVCHIGWSVYLVWAPILLLMIVLLATGTAMIAAAASLFFRDVKFIVEILLTFGIFFTPVFYDLRMLGNKSKWLMLNPVAPILEGLSDAVIRHQRPQILWLAYGLAAGIIALIGGYIFFKHLEPTFAESI